MGIKGATIVGTRTLTKGVTKVGTHKTISNAAAEAMVMVVVEEAMNTVTNVIDQDTLPENAVTGRKEAGAEEAAEDMEVATGAKPLHASEAKPLHAISSVTFAQMKRAITNHGIAPRIRHPQAKDRGSESWGSVIPAHATGTTERA